MNAIEVGKILPKVGSVADVNIFHEYYNASQKEIKYITFSYVPYNSVNDMVACTASGKTEVSGKLTGPIPPKHKSYVEWENMWFNPTVKMVVLTKIHVQYMDNTEEVIDGKDIVFMDDKNSAYYNEVALPEQKARAEREKKAAEERAAREKKEAEERAEREKKAAEQKIINDRKNELQDAYRCFKVFSCIKKAKEKNDDEMKFHANQGLWLFILEVLALFGSIIPLITIVFAGIAIFFSMKGIAAIRDGKRFDLPVLGKIKLIK